MSHNTETVICPNCGSEASNNYCSQCGQATHLHKETFMGLISHFIGHYFHYDSKFWQTMKELLFHPGKLTIAYKEKKRMRYIPPVSLYIFISAMFFLAQSLSSSYGSSGKRQLTAKEQYLLDSSASAQRRAALQSAIAVQETLNTKNAKSTIGTLRNELDKIDEKVPKDEKEAEKLQEKFMHTAPKIFFFMIPLMGFVIMLLFGRRKDNYFVDHTIFSLHFHSFWFTILLIPTIIESPLIGGILIPVAFLWSSIYFIVAFKRVYQTNWTKTILYSLIVGMSYFITLLALFIGIVYIYSQH